MSNRTFVGTIVVALAILTVLGIVSASFFSKKYVSSVEPLIYSLLEGRFDSARQSLFIPPNADTALFSDEKLAAIQDALKNSLNDRVTVQFNRSQKVISTNQAEATPEGMTRVFFDLVAEDQYVEVETLINDESQKVQYLNFSGAARQVPNLLVLSIIAVLFLPIPVLNIWAMVKIRSNLTKGRLWRYATVLLLNIPTVTYFAAGGINLSLLANQMVLGFSFNLSGLSQTSVSIGLPIGAVLWILIIRSNSRRSNTNANIAETAQETEVFWECPKCREKNSNSTFKCQSCEYSLK